jgi:hypothetical protein
LLGDRYTLSMKDVFVDYCLDLEPDIKYEDVQICGNKLSRGKFLNNTDQLAYMLEASLNKAAEEINGSDFECRQTETYGIECYQLFSQKLVLICSYEYNEFYCSNMYVFDNAKEFLFKVKELLSKAVIKFEAGGWNQTGGTKALNDEVKEEVKEEVYSYFKRSLISNGYRLSDVRSVY